MSTRRTLTEARAVLALESVAVALGILANLPSAHGDDFECGLTDGVQQDCATPQMTLAVFLITHQRIMQAPNSEWPTAEYVPGMLNVAPDFHNYINFASFNRTNLDVRIIRRRGADTANAWVTVDSTRLGVRNEITNMINAGNALPSDSTFFKNADGVFYYFGRLTDVSFPGYSEIDFCSVQQGWAWALLGSISHQSPGQYRFSIAANSIEVYWQRVLIHEVGHMFGLAHHPQSEQGQSCQGCTGCFGIMDLFLSRGCGRGTGYGYVPYHPLHLQQLGWADFVPISRDTTLYVRDLRIRPLIYKITPKQGYNDIFAFANLQRTNYDSVIAGEGLQITHAVDKNLDGWRPTDIWDIEIPQPMFVREAGTRCAAIPHVENPVTGVDTLQCKGEGEDSHLWPWPSGSTALGPLFNPSSSLYVSTAVAPYDPQSVTSDLYLSTSSLADSFVTGLKMIEVLVDFDWEPPMGPGFREPAVVVDPNQVLKVVPLATKDGVQFLITGDLRGLEELELYDSMGRTLSRIPLFKGTREREKTAILWNGRTGAERKVSSGVYFYRIRGPAGTGISGRFVLLR